MRPRPTSAAITRLFAVVVATAALLLPASPVGAASPTFGTPDATVTFGTGITFTIPFETATPAARIELRLRFPDTLGPFITAIDQPGAGSRPLSHTLDLSGENHLVPNTTIVATWAAFATLGGEPVLSRPLTVQYADTSHQWRQLKGDIVTVHWYEGTDAFARKALRIGDDAIRQTAALLGVTETAPIDFFIYGDETSFRTALGPGTRENVGGQAHSDIRTLFALITPDAINDPWVGVVIPHELVHLVFDTAVRNPYRFPPRWFNEGLAVYLSEGYGAGDRNRVEQAVSAGELLPLTALTGQFPTDSDKTYLAYAESVSAIDHLVRTDGKDALFALVGAYRDGLTDDEAFTKALGRNLGTFQAGWLKDLGADPPSQYGPQPAPPGPLPPGWSGPAQSSAPGVSPAVVNPTAAPASSGGAGDGSGTGAVLAAILAVVAVVVIALVAARRRAGRS
jgi:hypothetical protein